jgi:hypothetical protein
MSGKCTLSSAAYAVTKRICSCLLGLMIALPLPSFGQHLHELFYNNVDWVDTDLTALTGAGSAETQGVAAFYTTPNDQLHVYYASANDRHIHQLYNNGSSWSDSDLTSVTGGAIAFPGSGMSGFSIGNFQYVYFVAPDLHVHEYSFVNNWVDTDLTSLARGTGASLASDGLVAFATVPNNDRHVYFQAQNKTIHQLYFNGSTWSDTNLTTLSHGVKGNLTWMAGFAIGNVQYVFFEDKKGHVQEYFYVNNWADQDLTTLAGASNASTTFGNGVAAFVVPGTKKIKVFYSAAGSLNVHQLASSNNTKWTDTDLTGLSGGPAHGGEGQMAGFATMPNKQLHFYFEAVGAGDVNQLYFNGKAWSDQDLSALTGVSGAGGIGTPGMAGFAIGNLQRVYYINDTN